MDFEAVIELNHLHAHAPQIVRDRSDSIRLFDAQLVGMANDGRSVRERACDRQHRQFIDQLRNFFPLNDGALEGRARYFDGAARFKLFDIFDCFAHLRPHANHHAQKRGARVV